MKTIRISRQGFSLHGMHSWIKFFIFVLSKKYNVIVDPVDPDLIICSNLYHYKEGDYDTFLKAPVKEVTQNSVQAITIPKILKNRKDRSWADDWSDSDDDEVSEPIVQVEPAKICCTDSWD